MKPDFLVKTRRQAIARARRKFSLKDYSGALVEWDELLVRNDDDPLAWLGRFDCLMKLDRKAEMLEIGDKVCALFPESEAAHNNYACLLLEKREFDKACDHFDTALALAPEKTMYYFNAGLAYRGAGKLNQAAVCFEHVLVHEPGHERAIEFLSQIYIQFGMVAKATALSMRLRMLRPGYTLPLQRRLYAMMNDPEIGEDELNLELSVLRSALVNRPPTPQKTGGRPLRIGWILCAYSIGFLRYAMSVLQKQTKRANVTLVAFCNQPMLPLDDIEPFFDQLHRTPLATTDALAKLFRENPVDVLVDTAGQVPNNLVQHFAKRLAPLQVSWPFYHTQLEMILMDHALVDSAMMPDTPAKSRTPDANQVSLGDRVVSVGDTRFFYDSGNIADPGTTSSPAGDNGYITFGIVADPVRISQASVNAWARIMKKVPKSRITFYHRTFPALIAEQHLIERCEMAGLRADRVGFVPMSGEFNQRLDPYTEIDILLSPWPVTDDMTLIDAMLVGCPVVAMVQGVRGASRAGSILAGTGQQQFLAADQERYIAMGIDLARDIDQLANYRKKLPAAVAGSAICDHERAAGQWIDAIRKLAQE